MGGQDPVAHRLILWRRNTKSEVVYYFEPLGTIKSTCRPGMANVWVLPNLVLTRIKTGSDAGTFLKVNELFVRSEKFIRRRVVSIAIPGPTGRGPPKPPIIIPSLVFSDVRLPFFRESVAGLKLETLGPK